MSWSNYATATKFKDPIHRLFLEFIERERPRQVAAQVVSWDLLAREALVSFPQDPIDLRVAEPVKVKIAHLAPTAFGQTVIIDGPRAARRIVAVMGAAQVLGGSAQARLTHPSSNQAAAGWQDALTGTVELDTSNGPMTATPNTITIPQDGAGWWLVGANATFGTAGGTGKFGVRVTAGVSPMASQEAHRASAVELALSASNFVYLNGGSVLKLQTATPSATSTAITSRALWAIYAGNL